jgi:hypothetical protein
MLWYLRSSSLSFLLLANFILFSVATVIVGNLKYVILSYYFARTILDVGMGKLICVLRVLVNGWIKTVVVFLRGFWYRLICKWVCCYLLELGVCLCGCHSCRDRFY